MERPRRVRTFGRGRNHSLLPLRSDITRIPSLSSTISCWYCDYKFAAFNGFLFRFGRRYSRQLRVWFSIGVGFSLAALIGATLLLVWELATSLSILQGSSSSKLDDLASSFLFGFSPQVYGISLSIGDAAHLVFATLVSVSVHEFGHAIAAASEGIQVEYIALFIAVLFPGALVAFDYELLHGLERINALRVYCAGIWHNAACCAVCGLLLFLLPWILCPFYLHGENPMVLYVPSSSLLSGYLSPGDLIMSLDGKHVHDEHEWKELTTLVQDHAFQRSNWFNSTQDSAAFRFEKGYCVPTYVTDNNQTIHLGGLQYACPDGFAEFRAAECPGSNKLDEGFMQDEGSERRPIQYCLTGKDIVNLNKCGSGWLGETSEGSSCLCSEGESCLSPVQQPGLVWAEITYSRPYSSECQHLETDSSSDSETVDSMPHKCGGTFVFIGDLVSVAHSVQLTSYQPRYLLPFSAYIPKTLEKATICIFYASLALALLNSLPVLFSPYKNFSTIQESYFATS
ncbi:Membrane-bound transcription factor site-2 protease homolog [Linum perenne]